MMVEANVLGAAVAAIGDSVGFCVGAGVVGAFVTSFVGAGLGSRDGVAVGVDVERPVVGAGVSIVAISFSTVP